MTMSHARCPRCGTRYLRPANSDPGCPKGCSDETPVLAGQLGLFADGRTRAVNLRVEPHDVYAGRPAKGPDGTNDPRRVPVGERGWLGNPFDPRVEANALDRFREYFLERVERDEAFRVSVIALKGKRLGCFCAPRPCHAQTIAEWVEAQHA